MMRELGQNYYFSPFANYRRNWVQKCQTCVQDKRSDNSQLITELINVPENDRGPVDVTQINLLPELLPGGGYENSVTAIDVFSQYVFGYLVFNLTAGNTTKVFVTVKIRQDLPALMITDKGSIFVSDVIHELAVFLGITLHHTRTKHAQTLGTLKKNVSHKIGVTENFPGEFCQQWHKFLPLSFFELLHNISHK